MSSAVLPSLNRGARSAIKHLLDGAHPEAACSGSDAGAVTHPDRRTPYGGGGGGATSKVEKQTVRVEKSGDRRERKEVDGKQERVQEREIREGRMKVKMVRLESGSSGRCEEREVFAK